MAGLTSLDTQNQHWASDRTKFGYRMLQKMGWTEGKGLGACENGTTEHVRVHKKLGTGGIGSDERNTAWDVPGKVANGLNDVLNRLQPVSVGDVDTMGGMERKKKGEGKRVRGYYERRRHGKNVGSYSKKALAEIFGGVGAAGGKTGLDGGFGERQAKVESEFGEEERVRKEKEERKLRRKEKKERKERKEKKVGIKAVIDKDGKKRKRKSKKETPSR